MNSVVVSSLVLVMSAGAALGAVDEEPVALVPSSGHVVQAAHIYFNMATGERVVTTLHDATSPANDLSGDSIWASLVRNQCADEGFTTEYFFGVDNNSGYSTLSSDITCLDFGDIALDTVVDMVHISWASAHHDVDSDSDGVGDGVVGLGGEWIYWDADNGRESNVSTRLPLISLQFIDLPANINGGGMLTSYTADIDLAGSFSSSMTFEIGDSDGVSDAAFFHNNVDTNSDGIGDGVSIANADRDFDGNPDSDLDGDGLFDWAWSVRFAQPGTRDLDGDGEIDGDYADSLHTIGINFGAGEGTAIDNGDGTWAWDLNTSDVDAANGQEDAYALFAPPNADGEILHAGFFWFGGLACIDENGYTPGASFEHQLFGPGGPVCCCADFNHDGSLNFFDISAFLKAYSAGDLGADFTADGTLNFFDISAFLAGFAAGCP
jgi:hypothetical protein